MIYAQAADFFTLHDDNPATRTQEHAVQDAKAMCQQIQQIQQARMAAALKQPKQARANTRRK